MLLLLFKVDIHESSARVTVFPLLAFHVCFLWTMSPKLRLWSSSRVSYFRFRFKDSFSSCFYKIYVCLPIFFPSFLIIKMHSLCFFLHLSISGKVNNIKIICSIRFSLLITINRFYKLFLVEDAFVNRRPEMIFPLFFIPLSPSNLRPFGAPPSIGRREYPRKPLPLEGAAERSEAGLASFLGGKAASSLPFPLGKALRREKRWIGCSR